METDTLTETTLLHQKYPMITLENGVSIVNSSSAHEYRFDTGEVLPACTPEVANTTQLSDNHTRRPVTLTNHRNPGGIALVDVEINYEITDSVLTDITTLAEMDDVDRILVPYVLHDAWKRALEETTVHKYAFGHPSDQMRRALKKMRVSKLAVENGLADRVNHTISSTEFCN